MYYTTLETYKKKYQNRSLTHAYSAKTKEEHEVWKKSLRDRLWEITGMNKCVYCEPDAQYLRTDCVNELIAEYWVIKTEPEIEMPFYLLRPEQQNPDCKQKKHPILIVPHGHGGGKESTIQSQTKFIRDALEDGFLVVCPDERGSGDRREFPEQGDEPEKIRMNSHRELLQVCIGFGQSVIGMAVWDLMRLADYLLALSESNGFLACAGMSGGGQQTVWFSAMDDRVKAAITPRPFFVESGEKDGLNGKSGLNNVTTQLDVTRKAYHIFNENAYPIHSIHSGGHQWVGTGMRTFLIKAMEKE